MKPRCGPARSSRRGDDRPAGRRGAAPGSAVRRGAATATASAGNMSVSRLTSSNWRVPSGDRPPSAVPTTVNATSPALPPTSTATASRTRAHIARPSARASTRRVRSASVSTRSAERRAAGDSAPPRPRRPRRRRRAGSPRRRSPRRRSSPAWPRPCAARRRAPPSAPGTAGRTPRSPATMRTRSASDARSELRRGDDPVARPGSRPRRRWPTRSRGGRRWRPDPHPAARSCAIPRRRLADAVGERDQPAQREACRRGRRGRPGAPVDGRSATAITRSPSAASRSTRVPGVARVRAAVEHDLRRALHDEAAVAQARGEPAAGGERQAASASLRVSRARGGRDGPVDLVECVVGGSPAPRPARAGRLVGAAGPSGTSRTTRSRFSVSVPVLSKQTVSTRPSASSTRALRTTAPRRESRRAAACCATVATSGNPSGTAATATATPALTPPAAAPPQQRQPGDGPAAGRVSGSTARVSSPSRACTPGRRRGHAGGGAARPAAVALTDGHDHGAAAPGDDGRALRAACRSGRRAPRRASPARPCDRLRLTGEPRLVDLEVTALQQARVGGDDVAGLDADHVADPQRARRHLLGRRRRAPRISRCDATVLLEQQRLQHRLGAQPLRTRRSARCPPSRRRRAPRRWPRRAPRWPRRPCRAAG